MFKLTVVGGPARGQSYTIRDGENSIGRVPGNDIVLTSQKVSKRHCVLVVNNRDVTVKDEGSSNGTFVNGVLTKLKKLLPGDRVSVGEYVFELTKIEEAKQRSMPVPLNMPNNVVPMPGMTGLNIPAPGAAQSATPSAGALPPQNLKEKIQFYFEQYVINFVYNLNEKHEWRQIMAGMFMLLTLASSLLAVYPVLERVSEKLGGEARERALLIARQIVDRNAPLIYERLEVKVDIGFAEKERGVLSAFLTDMEGRIMAPGRKLNQYITEPNEASFSAQAREKLQKSDKPVVRVMGDTVAVAVPVQIFSASAGRNINVAVGMVFFDRTMVMFDSGTEALAYIQAIILAAIVTVIIYFSLYRLTLRPLTALNEDIDKVLKGNATLVEKKYKMEEIEPLVDIVNAALQRVSPSGTSNTTSMDPAAIEELVQMLKFSASKMTDSGMMIFSGDRRIMYVSPFFEEISGIRNETALGQDIGSAARDAAFVSFVEDALARAPSVGSDPLAEDFEFSGTTYRMECLAYGQPGAIKAFALVASRG